MEPERETSSTNTASSLREASLSADSGIDAAAQFSADLIPQIQESGWAPAFERLEKELERYEEETGGTVEELLPPSVEPLAFQVPSLRRGEEFARKVLCDSKEDVRAPIEGSVQFGLPVVIGAVMGSLSLPPVAIGVAATIAAIVMVRGIKGFCEDVAGE